MAENSTLQGSLPAFRASLRGKVLTLEEDGAQFEAANEIFNHAYAHRKPGVIVQPLGVLDVKKAIAFAREHSLEVAVKSGGHSVKGHGTVDKGLVIDLRSMRGVLVDPLAKTITIQGGATLGDIDEETGVYDLLLPLGHARMTGFGLILGGGIGVPTRRFGLPVDSLLSLTLVTASGEVVTCTHEVEEDLFWACHGAAPNFGVVTHATFKLHDVGTTYYGGPIIKPFEAWLEAAHFLRDVATTDPDFCMILIAACHPEAGPVAVSWVHYFGPKSKEEKAALITPLRALNPIQDVAGMLTYAQNQDAMTPLLLSQPKTRQYWVHRKVKDDISDEFLQVYRDAIAARPECLVKYSIFLLDLQGGLGYEKPAYGPLHTSGLKFSWYAVLAYEDEKDDDVVKAFARELREKLAPFSEEVTYANMQAEGSGNLTAQSAGGEDNIMRLKSVKRQWDPTNFFHLNNNIVVD